MLVCFLVADFSVHMCAVVCTQAHMQAHLGVPSLVSFVPLILSCKVIATWKVLREAARSSCLSSLCLSLSISNLLPLLRSLLSLGSRTPCGCPDPSCSSQLGFCPSPQMGCLQRGCRIPVPPGQQQHTFGTGPRPERNQFSHYTGESQLLFC